MQWRVVCNAFERCTLPFFVTICFTEITKWKSYSDASDTVIPFSLDKSIAGLFDQASVTLSYSFCALEWLCN